MTIHLRPFNPGTDIPRLAELINAAAPQPLPQETVRALLTTPIPGRIHLRTVAVDGASRIIGSGEVGHDPWMLPGRFWIDIVVAPAARGRGVGAMLGDDLVAFAWELGATTLVAPVRPHIPASRRFLEHRGFVVRGGLATLDLAAYLRERDRECEGPDPALDVELGITLLPSQAELDALAAQHGLFELTLSPKELAHLVAAGHRCADAQQCWCGCAAS